MNSRYGLWFLSLCCISLTGCANWQSRMGNNAPGSAASSVPVSAPMGAPILSAPSHADLNAPPPGAPIQSDFNTGLPPLSAPAGQKLDLSSVSSDSGEVIRETSSKSSSPRAMYNLEGNSKSSSEKSNSDSRSEKSSTIAKLANKASGKSVASAKPVKSSLSTVQKLSMDASKSEETPKVVKAEPAVVKSAPQGVATSPPPTPNEITTGDNSDAVIDTTLLAQPVRKGSSEDKSDSDSKGPQSRALPTKSFLSTRKPVIYPVSNPVQEEPVNLIRFS